MIIELRKFALTELISFPKFLLASVHFHQVGLKDYM